MPPCSKTTVRPFRAGTLAHVGCPCNVMTAMVVMVGAAAAVGP